MAGFASRLPSPVGTLRGIEVSDECRPIRHFVGRLVLLVKGKAGLALQSLLLVLFSFGLGACGDGMERGVSGTPIPGRSQFEGDGENGTENGTENGGGQVVASAFIYSDFDIHAHAPSNSETVSLAREKTYLARELDLSPFLLENPSPEMGVGSVLIRYHGGNHESESSSFLKNLRGSIRFPAEVQVIGAITDSLLLNQSDSVFAADFLTVKNDPNALRFGPEGESLNRGTAGVGEENDSIVVQENEVSFELNITNIRVDDFRVIYLFDPSHLLAETKNLSVVFEQDGDVLTFFIGNGDSPAGASQLSTGTGKDGFTRMIPFLSPTPIAIP